MSNISLLERETIICFNEAEPLARVYTFNPSLIRKINVINEKSDQKIEIKDEGYGEVQFYIPKEWVTIRKTRVYHLTEEEREKKRENIKKVNAERWKKNNE